MAVRRPTCSLDVFADVPHVMVCVKDSGGRATWAPTRRSCGGRAGAAPSEVLGRRAIDLFPDDLAASYEAQDRSLLLTGREIRNHLELIEDHTGRRRWYLTSKVRAR